MCAERDVAGSQEREGECAWKISQHLHHNNIQLLTSMPTGWKGRQFRHAPNQLCKGKAVGVESSPGVGHSHKKCSLRSCGVPLLYLGTQETLQKSVRKTRGCGDAATKAHFWERASESGVGGIMSLSRFRLRDTGAGWNSHVPACLKSSCSVLSSPK